MNFLDQRLDELDFGPGYGVRLQHAFKMGIWTIEKTVYPVTVRDLVALYEYDIMRQVNLGRGSLNKIKEVLAPHGLHFGMTPPPLPTSDLSWYGG